jgi:hypothetical protein
MTAVIDPWAITDNDEAQALPTTAADSATPHREAGHDNVSERPGRPRRPTAAAARRRTR